MNKKLFFAKLKYKLYLFCSSYFRFWAGISLKRWHPRIILVTGSAGKTTMLNLIASQLGDRAHYSHNANSLIGIAFDILGMHGVTKSRLQWIPLLVSMPFRAFIFCHHEPFYVVEADAACPQVGRKISKWLRPEVTLWVTLGRTHAQWFDDTVKSGRFADVDTAIADEFSAFPRHTRKLVIIDADNPKMVECCRGITATVKAVSAKTLRRYRVWPDRAEFRFKNHTYVFHEPLPPESATQLVMLEALMQYLKLPLKTALDDFRMPPARCNFLEGKNGVKIIDSSYNAHIISMRSVLAMVKALQTEHKWLIVGDFIEQGKIEREEHCKLAEILLDAKPERLILLGRRTRKYTYPLVKDKLDAVSFLRAQDVLSYLEKQLTGQETLIFKGSQHLEWVIEKLLKNPDDRDKLARQDAMSRRRRLKIGLK